MISSILPLRDTMGTHRIGKLVEHLVLADELVDQHLAALVVDVVVTGAVDEQQVALETAGEVDGRAVMVTLRIERGDSGVSLSRCRDT